MQGQKTRDSLIEPQPQISPQDIKEQYGIDVKAPMPDYEAKYMADAQARQKQYQMATENASGIKTFAANTASFLADPINLGSLFIPYIGEERIAATLGVDTATAGGRAVTRAATTAGAGVVSQAPLSALKYGFSQTQGTDYGVADALKDTLYAGAAGAIAGPLFGTLFEAILGKPEWAAQIESSKFTDNQAASQVGLSQLAKENPLDVQPIKDINYSNDFRQKQTNMLSSAEDAESYRNKNANIIGQEKFYDPQSSDQDILKSMESIPQRMADVNERLADTSLPPDWRKTLESYRDKLSSLSDKYSDYHELHQNEMKLAEWRGEATPSNRDIPPLPAATEVQQFIQSSHENGTLGLSKQETQATTDAAEAAIKEPPIDHEAEAAKLQQQADELEEQLRFKSDMQSMAEHDAWKQQQGTLTNAYTKLAQCLST